jgi:membrane protease subunit HflK
VGWNDSGDQKNPWKQGGDKGPPDLDAIVRDLQRKLSGLFGGRGGGGRSSSPVGGGFIGAALVGVIAVWALTGFYKIDDAARGVVLRFGAYDRVSMPGLRWRVPWPVEALEKVNVTKREEFPYKARMLTGDENIIDIDLIVQYYRSDPQAYLFSVRDPEDTLRDVTRSAIRETVGKSNLDFVLTTGRADIAERTKVLIQSTLDSYRAGLTIFQVSLQKANFPSQVEASVQDAVKAREDRDRLSLEAQAYANDILPRARGAAVRQIQDAEAYRERVVADAEGEANRFVKILSEYEKAPEVTRQRLYLETLEAVMSNSTKVVLDSEGDGNVIYLPLDRLMERGRSDGSTMSRSGNSGPRSQPPETTDRGGNRLSLRSRDRGELP